MKTLIAVLAAAAVFPALLAGPAQAQQDEQREPWLAPVVMTPIATHVDYWVGDLESALDFYTQQLGWELEFIEAGKYAMLSVDGHFRLGLIAAASRLPDWRPGDPLPGPSLCLMTVDMEAEEARLAAEGITLADVSADSQVIVKSFTDRSGNSITLYQPNMEPGSMVSNEQPDPEAAPPTILTGWLRDLEGAPLGGATLVIINPETGTVLARIATADDGSFTAELWQGGAFELRIFDSAGTELVHSHEALELSEGKSHELQIVGSAAL